MRRSMLKAGVLLVATQILGSGQVSASQAAPSPEELLKDSDRARGAVEVGMTWNSNVETIDGKNTSKIVYLIKAKGDQAVAETVAPEASKGEYMVFKERNLWYVKPGMKRPVVISARQKLSGAASNADIVSTNYFRDYDGTIVGEEKVEGVDCWKLDLKAKAKNVSYNGIRYWISKSNHLGLKAEFLGVKGETFKHAEFKYDNKISSAGKERPFMSKIVIKDAQKADSNSTIVVSTPKIIDVPDGSLDVKNFIK